MTVHRHVASRSGNHHTTIVIDESFESMTHLLSDPLDISSDLLDGYVDVTAAEMKRAAERFRVGEALPG